MPQHTNMPRRNSPPASARTSKNMPARSTRMSSRQDLCLPEGHHFVRIIRPTSTRRNVVSRQTCATRKMLRADTLEHFSDPLTHTTELRAQATRQTLVVEYKSHLQVDSETRNPAIDNVHFLILNPCVCDIFQGLAGSSYTHIHGIFETCR